MVGSCEKSHHNNYNIKQPDEAAMHRAPSTRRHGNYNIKQPFEAATIVNGHTIRCTYYDITQSCETANQLSYRKRILVFITITSSLMAATCPQTLDFIHAKITISSRLRWRLWLSYRFLMIDSYYNIKQPNGCYLIPSFPPTLLKLQYQAAYEAAIRSCNVMRR